MHDAARKAAIKDQETAGIDIVSDGESAARQHDRLLHRAHARCAGRSRLEALLLRLLRERRAIEAGDRHARVWSKSEVPRPVHRAHASKISISGPHTLVKRIQNKHYPTEEAFALDLGRVLNLELKELVRAGATHLQIDEPYYSGFPEDLPWALKAINAMVDGVNAHVTLHICYGNRYGKPSFEGSYQFLFPAILEAKVQAVSMEFARRGEDDLQLFKGVQRPVPGGHRRHRRQDQRSRIAGVRGRSDSPRARGDPGRAAHHHSRLRSGASARARSRSASCARWSKARGRSERNSADDEALAERVTSGQFVYMTELVASGLKREAQVLEIASKLAMIPEIAAGSITSYAGGQLGQDSIRVGTAVRARGLVPNVHLTCVGQDRKTIEKTLVALQALEMHNIFSISGDWPKAAMRTAVFDIDSVQLAAHIAELRARTGTPFFISCAVSPFKYQREDLPLSVPEARKEDRGRRRHGDHAGRLGRDEVRRAEEVSRRARDQDAGARQRLRPQPPRRRADEHRQPAGMLGVRRARRRAAKESEAPDGGLQARLERAARSSRFSRASATPVPTSVARTTPSTSRWIIRRAEELAPKWEELRGAAVRQEGRLLPLQARSAAEADAHLPAHGDGRGREGAAVRAVVEDVKDSPVKRDRQGAFRWLDRHPRLSHWFERFEYYGKKEVFGCQNCGNCVLGSMEYVCPQTCPKQMRNGPCGGTFHGACEVIDQECIWVKVMARAEASNTIDQLKVYIPPPDRRLTGTASWVNFYLGRDSQPGRPKDLWKTGAGPGRTVADRRRRAAQDRRAAGRRQGVGGTDAAEAGGAAKAGRPAKWR